MANGNAQVDGNGISTQTIPFAVNRLTTRQYLAALENTRINPETNENMGALDENAPYLLSSEFYMTVDEAINSDFQLSNYVNRVEFYQTVSSMINFRGVTMDGEWASKLSAYADLSAADSPSDLYVHYDAGNPQISNENAPYERPSHGDFVFYGKTGREFMYTQVESRGGGGENAPLLGSAEGGVGYWSEIGNDWMLSVIQITTKTAVEGISGVVDDLSGDLYTLSGELNQTSSFLSGQILDHVGNTDNPHQVNAGQINAYLCAQTSSAVELDAAFGGKLDTSLCVGVIAEDTAGSRIPDVNAVKGYARGNAVFVDDRISGASGYTDISVIKLSVDQYADEYRNGLLSNCLYLVETPYVNAYGQQVKNVAEPADISDAATKGYVDGKIQEIAIPTDLSAFTNSPGYLVSADVLSAGLIEDLDDSLCAYARPDLGQDEGWIVSLSPGYKSCSVPEYDPESNEWQIDVRDKDDQAVNYVINGQPGEKYLAFQTGENDFVYARKAKRKNLMGLVTDEYMDDVIPRLLLRLQLIESQIEDTTTVTYQTASGIATREVPVRGLLTRDHVVAGGYSADQVVGVAFGKLATGVGMNALSGCTNLTSIALPQTVKQIGQAAFSGCQSLADVTVPAGLADVGNGAFRDCTSLTSIPALGRSTSIKNQTFRGCAGLTEAEIPETVREINTAAFAYCTNLSAVDVGNVSAIGKEAFSYCAGLQEVKTTSNLSAIDYFAFSRCINLSSIEFKDGLRYIGSNAFLDCKSLPDVTLPPTLLSVDVRAFYSTNSISSIDLGQGLVYIGSEAFGTGGSKLTAISIPEQVSSIADDAFVRNYRLSVIDVAAGNQWYSSSNNMLLTKDGAKLIQAPTGARGKLEVPEGVVSAVYSGFFFSQADEIALPSTLSCVKDGIAYGVFQYCPNVSAFSVPEGNQWYKSSGGMLLTKEVEGVSSTLVAGVTPPSKSASIPEGVSAIAPHAFAGRSRLLALTGLDKVSIIGEGAFEGCTGLCKEGDNWFFINDGVAYAYNQNYKGAVVPEGTKIIGQGAMRDLTQISSLTIADSVSCIQQYACYSTTGLVSVDIPSGVASVGRSAFQGTGANPIIMHDGLTSLGIYAFSDCDRVLSLEFPSTLVSIPSHVAFGCDKLSSVVVNSENTQVINDGAFKGCPNLKDVTLPDSILTIANQAFYDCPNLTGFTMPQSVKTISAEAFSGCKSLQALTIESPNIKIGERAFEDCYALTSLKFNGKTKDEIKVMANYPWGLSEKAIKGSDEN